MIILIPDITLEIIEHIFYIRLQNPLTPFGCSDRGQRSDKMPTRRFWIMTFEYTQKMVR